MGELFVHFGKFSFKYFNHALVVVRYPLNTFLTRDMYASSGTIEAVCSAMEVTRLLALLVFILKQLKESQFRLVILLCAFRYVFLAAN